MEKEREGALLICPVLSHISRNESREARLNEAAGLIRAISLDVLAVKAVQLKKPTAPTFLGRGTCEDVKTLIAEKNPDIVVVDCTLSPVQQRNLEELWETKVIDRTGLILEIFGERARTREGKIQVELAAMEYQRSRLVRSWTHLERQRGGAGFMGGPGETQIELDRRMVVKRISKLKKELEQVRKTRNLQRQSRERIPFPVIALVGYTNAGKSTLFNRLTGANVLAEDMPFATLDPTMRKLTLSNGQESILSDTVGFIADLPTHLVAAFRATLEQVEHADIILHVRDISRPDHEVQKEDVIKTLKQLGIEYEQDNRIVEVLNKIDVLPPDEREELIRQSSFKDNILPFSAQTGEGEETLLAQIEQRLSQNRKTVTLTLALSNGKALAWLHEHAHILKKEEGKEDIRLTVDIAPATLSRFKKKFSA